MLLLVQFALRPRMLLLVQFALRPRMMLLVQFATVRNLLYPQRTLIYASCRIVGNPARIECGHELYPRTRSLVLTI
jgi:hypothetical protein